MDTRGSSGVSRKRVIASGGVVDRHAGKALYYRAHTVVVAQLEEHKVVVLGVAGSSPVDHP